MESISILGCGWLGKPLAIELKSGGHIVRGSTTHLEKVSLLNDVGIEAYCIDFVPVLKGNAGNFFQSDILIITIPPRRKSGQTDVYLEQINHIVDCASKGNIAKTIFISSTAVYPDLNSVVSEEDADPSHYLVQAENMVKACSSFKTTIIRFGGLFGHDRHPGKFLSGKKDVAGGANPVNVIPLTDCIGVIKSIIQQNVWGETFNACADHHPSKKEFYTKASEELGLEPPHFSGKDNTPFKIVSNTRIKERLNYQFEW